VGARVRERERESPGCVGNASYELEG